jgi:hypothetical protein
MKTIKLTIMLSVIVAGTEFSAFAFTPGSVAPYCGDCMARKLSADETAANSFCYPSILADDTRINGGKAVWRSSPNAWLLAGIRDTRVCLQVANIPGSNIVSF